MRAQPGFRATLGVKLALVLFGTVVGALFVAYLMVVPRLENRLVDAKTEQLETAVQRLRVQVARALEENIFELQETVDTASANLNARVVIFQRSGDALLAIRDSSTITGGGNISQDPVARSAAARLAAVSGRAERGDSEYAEAAAPLGRRPPGSEIIILASAPLEDALSTVQLLRSSLVVAALVALAAAAAAAYGAALALTRRLRRLEAAAGRIAAGDFDVPVDTRGSDEVAELAREFDSMRLRLADLDRVRREFIANASHELRTPLFSLGGFLELLADEDLEPETRTEFLAETRMQVERLTRLATDLLDLSRLDAGQLLVEAGDVDLAAVARTTVEEFRAVAEASEHPLQVAADRATPVVGDHQRVLQIARILVENALRHTPPGTRIQVTVAREGESALLAVCDEGPGIPVEEQERVFQRFYRAAGGKASGSGLGLAIAAELATKMGGRLHVESRPGETTFTLRLPSPDTPLIPHGNSAARERPAATPSGRA